MADHRHKRVTNARRKMPKAVLVSAPLALAATVATVSAGVLLGTPVTPTLMADANSSLTAANPQFPTTTDRPEEVSRELGRAYLPASQLKAMKLRDQRMAAQAATAKAVRRADTRLWATTDLNLWSDAGKDARILGEIAAGDKVLVTGRTAEGRSEVVVKGKSRWVTSGYFSDEKPLAAAAGLSMEPCPDPGVESGLTSDAVYVYRSVCHAFPQITSYGGWDNHGEHSSGRALDIMTSDSALGSAIADFLQAHAAELNLYDILWQQHIWTPVRSSEGWRSMPSRGSSTANHYDHVHVSVN
ncbi:mucin-2 protein [Nocardioides sp.]|uniref:mucin-2 protein n=1 Tax=Nocardioides sp. TaxID=35761 RepID=UPI003D0B81B5